MSISSPLPSTALSNHPLQISLSLNHLPAPPGQSSTNRLDPFDALDEGAEGWDADYGDLGADGAEGLAERGPAEASSSPPPRTTLSSALSDSAGVLFPHISLSDEARLAELQDATAGGEGELPSWLKEASGRVTALTSARIRESGDRGTNGDNGRRREEVKGQQPQGGRGELRVAAGCEDGTVWVFAPPKPPSSDLAHGQPTKISADLASATLAPRRLSRESISAPISASSSTPSSPPTSPSTGSRRNFSSISPSSPRLTSRRSSASLSTLASTATTRNHRVSSSSSSVTHAASLSGQSTSGASYEVVRSVSRPRKASATVSISTSSALPSSSHSPRSDLPDLPTLPTSPTPTSSRGPSSPPISPTIPHFVFSGPSPRPSQNPLGSKKEGARTPRSDGGNSLDGGPTSVPLQKRSHSRAKGSIASGIGLWETDGAASSRSSLASPTEERGSIDVGLSVETVDEQVEVVEETLDELLPVLQIRSAGWGEVIALEVVEGVECADADEGVALVVLRKSGHLSVVSLVDGRTFGACDAAAKTPGSSRSSGPAFSSLQIVTLASTVFAICADSTTTVPVHLGSLEPQPGLDGDFGPAGPLLVHGEGIVSLLHPTTSTSPEEPPALFVTRLTVNEMSNSSSVPTLSLDEPQQVGILAGLKGSLKSLRRAGKSYVASDGSSAELFALRDTRIVSLARLDSNFPIRDLLVDPEGRYLVLIGKERSRIYRLMANGDEASAMDHVRDLPSAVESVTFLSSPSRRSVLFSRAESKGQRALSLVQLDDATTTSKAEPSMVEVYRSAPRRRAQITSVKVVGVDRVLLGYSTGSIALVNIADLAASPAPPPAKAELVGAVTLLDTLELGGRQVVIAGSASGMAGAWNLSDFDPVGSWTLFASPVKSFAYIDPSPTSSSKLGNTIAFISANSPIALVSLFPPELLFVLPGTKSGVELIATTKDDIMVLYEQGLARTCDIASRELRRSMDRRTAEKTLAEGGWTVWFRLSKERSSASPALSAADPLLHFDLRNFLDEAALRLPWTDSRSTKKRDWPANGTPTASPDPGAKHGDTKLPTQVDDRGIARQLVAALATFGLDQPADELLQQLDISIPAVPLTPSLQSDQAVSVYNTSLPSSAWTTSPAATAQHLLHLVCLLRVFLNYPETERSASQAIVYYASCLADVAGPPFAPPSLEVFARFWLDKNVEVQQAARSLFGTYLAAMPDDAALAFVERWQNSLPARQSGLGVLHHQADHALLVVGLVATERYKLLSSSVLKDLAVSISTYLDNHEHPFHQAVATELCSRGFGIWQNYVDAASLVRQLFAVAIGRNPATPNDLRLLARNATLHVATVNTSLFMTTLVHDIVNAPTATARNATLKLLGFMIRKKPLVLYTSLPRVAEAVVKSLDPTVSTLRETVHQAATVILNELVKTFPSIDFHGKSQRLAVGTHEGAAIVFDLRTATRLYVLEGHSRAVTALSWSPDGHRLVTVSLEESRVAAWKVGVGLLSMFLPGAPPRQGAGSSTTPFKTYDFHVGDEALMTTAATLEWVVFDWPAERTVRLRLRETALNFGV